MELLDTELALPPSSWEEIWELEPGQYTWVQGARLSWQPDGTPDGALRVLLIITGSENPFGTKTCELKYVDGASALERFFGEPHGFDGVKLTNGRWAKVATATPPQVYDLPIWNGYEAVDEEPAAYRKTQNGRCYVYAMLRKADGSHWESGANPAGLPEGYRPPCHIVRPCFFSSGGGPAGYGHLHLYHDGRIIVQALPANIDLIWFDIAFWTT